MAFHLVIYYDSGTQQNQKQNQHRAEQAGIRGVFQEPTSINHPSQSRDCKLSVNLTAPSFIQATAAQEDFTALSIKENSI